ncbi:MAG: AAA family ATPase [Oscillospiraceae bacterium]
MGNKLKTVDAETLLSTPMSKTMFIVDGLISQGVNVISGASKIGKSWLMLWLGLQVAQGNSIWGLPTLQCDVLYMSLEDTQRRIKDRLYNLTDSAPDNLYFAVTSGLIGGGLEEQITDFLTEHPATKLVIIDTLQKVRDSKGSAGKAGMYGNDYDDISSIKRIADGFNIAILLVHHLRKLQDSDDPFNDVSGSTGIIGAADTNFILRRKRSGNAATLLVSGRDVEYQELTLQFNDLVWELVERKNSEDIHKAELPKFLFRVVDFMECRTEWVGTPVIVRELSDDEAVIAMVDANLQRETILPSEKAFAYKMKLDAIKHQGIASVQVAEKLLSVEKVADDAGESKDQVRRYIRLTYLIPELLSMVDDGKIAFNPAVELSYLDSYQQRAVLDAMALNDCAPSHAQSIRLKKLAQEGVLDDQMIYAVLAETKPNQQEQLKFKREELRKYFPSGYTEEQMRRDIIKGLELLKRQRERNRDAR